MIDLKRFSQQLQALVAAPSVSCTSPDLDMSNKQVIDLLANWLEALDFRCEILAVDGFPGKYNLVATLGQGPGGLVLAGHTDTVPCDPNMWDQDPFQLQEKANRFYGLGATDMKGFFPVVLAAIAKLQAPLKQIQQPLIILATADEESSMCGARAIADSGYPQARYAVIGEPTGLRPIRMHKGIMMESVRVQGQAGHSSDPRLGKNALETMHAVISELLSFRREMQSRYVHPGFEIQSPTLNLGCIHGGDNPNRICGACELHYDLRTVPGISIDDLHYEIAHRLKPIGEAMGTPITIEKLFPGIEAYEEPATSELVQASERLTGHKATSVAFATEAPFLQHLGMQTIVMGPGSIEQAHQPNEYLELAQIEPAIEVVTSLIRRFCLQDETAL